MIFLLHIYTIKVLLSDRSPGCLSLGICLSFTYRAHKTRPEAFVNVHGMHAAGCHAKYFAVVQPVEREGSLSLGRGGDSGLLVQPPSRYGLGDIRYGLVVGLPRVTGRGASQLEV